MEEENHEQHNAKEEMIEIMEKCNSCGMCKELCPVFKIFREEQYSPRGHAVLLSNNIVEKIVFDCTLCRACEEKCPLGIKVCDAIKKARQVLNLSGKENSENKKMLDRVLQKKNPFLGD